MRFGQTHVLRTAKGKIGVGIAVLLLGMIAVYAAPTDTDKLLCAVLVVVGSAFITRGIRQDREEKRKLQEKAEQPAKPKKRKKK